MSEVILSVKDLQVRFPLTKSIFAKRKYLYAVDGVSFELNRGETLAIVGESGSGKTTTALAIARLIKAFAGQVQLGDVDLLSLNATELRDVRNRMQFIFQDPYSSLNPRLRACLLYTSPSPRDS